MSDPIRMIQMTRGAATAVAAAVGVSRAAVSQWAKAGRVPPKKAAAVEQALEDFIASHHGRAPAPEADAPHGGPRARGAA